MIAKDCLRCKVIISTWSRWSSRWSLKKLKKGIPVGTWTRNFCILSNYGHTQLNPPHPVRSAQLNSWWQSQYYGGGPHGNTLCCNFFFFFFWTLNFFFERQRWGGREREGGRGREGVEEWTSSALYFCFRPYVTVSKRQSVYFTKCS